MPWGHRSWGTPPSWASLPSALPESRPSSEGGGGQLSSAGFQERARGTLRAVVIWGHAAVTGSEVGSVRVVPLPFSGWQRGPRTSPCRAQQDGRKSRP